MSGYEVFDGPAASRFASLTVIGDTGSTNADLFTAASDGAPEGSVLVARRQTAGKGRQGRVWSDHGGSSLFMSLVLRPVGYQPSLIPAAVGLALLEAAGECGLEARLKWPNDLVVPAQEEKKLAGILAEVGTADDGSLFVVVGVGINLILGPDLDPETRERATDLASGGETPPDPVAMAGLVLGHLETNLQALEAGRDWRVVESYRRHCISIGRVSEFDTPTGKLIGRVVGIADDGSLRMRTADGTNTYHAGDLHHRDDLTAERAFHRPS